MPDAGSADGDELTLPPEDRCAGRGHPCGLTRAEHTGWMNGGPSHGFAPPAPRPRPERIASSSIVTEWTCTHCGAGCDVWGVADDEWMECGVCGKQSFVAFTSGVPEPPRT